MARARGIHAISFTDHMDTGWIQELMLAGNDVGVKVFSGVEISTAHQGREYHLLLYGFSPDDALVGKFIGEVSRAVWDRAHACIDVFRRMGFDLEEADVEGWGRSVPTGVTLLDALLKKNGNDPRLRPYIDGPMSASPYMNFYRDFAEANIGEIVVDALPGLLETVRLLRGRGIGVLAHPEDTALELIMELACAGLDGLEVYSTHHSRSQEARLLGSARSLGLMVSAGSDFHGERIKPDVKLGQCRGRPDVRLVDALMGAWVAG